MKVNITKDSRAWMTLDEYEQAKLIVKEMREDEYNARDYIEIAARCWLEHTDMTDRKDYVKEVHKADAEICRNGRVWGAYSDRTGCLDIWVTGVVETLDGFLKIGVCLSDVWGISPDEFNRDFPTLCYARYYTEKQ